MKRFNDFIKQLSLSQQLFALIFFFVSFFAVFFFVYVNGSISSAIKSQLFESLDATQSTLIATNRQLIMQESAFFASANGIDILSIHVNSEDQDQQVLIAPGAIEDLNIEVQSQEWQVIIKDVLQMIKGNQVNQKSHGIVENVNGEKDSYYSILKLSDSYLLVSRAYSDNMDQLEKVILNSVVYITVIVVGFFFIILMLWVLTLIHPLNQIRNYIERVKLGKEAHLRVNRKDEIGELASALVSMRDELFKQERTKEEMIHNISHDLKTPIATIKSYGESIKDGIYPYETLEKSVDVIIENADRLESKVYSLLYMNRVEYLISQESDGVVTNMQELIEKVIQNIKAIKPQIHFEMDLSLIYFDGLEEPWRVVVENIMDNALRYAHAKIVVRLNEAEGLSVENDGDSIDEERMKVLFKPYEMGAGGRFGIGLSIVAKVASANHYEVCGENTAEGVIFRIFRRK